MEAPASDLHAAYYGFLCEADELPVVAPLAQQDLEAAIAGASTSTGKGRKRTKQLQDDDSDELSDEEDEGGKKAGKKGRAPGSDAARNKASREKARREKINDRCGLNGARSGALARVWRTRPRLRCAPLHHTAGACTMPPAVMRAPGASAAMPCCGRDLAAGRSARRAHA